MERARRDPVPALVPVMYLCIVPVLLLLCIAGVSAQIAAGPVTPYQPLMDAALREHYNAMNNLENCDYSAAAANGRQVYNYGQQIYSTWGQQTQGNILMKDGNNIISAVNSLRAGKSVNFPDIASGSTITFHPCGSEGDGGDVSPDDTMAFVIPIVAGALIFAAVMTFASSKAAAPPASPPPSLPQQPPPPPPAVQQQTTARPQGGTGVMYSPAEGGGMAGIEPSVPSAAGGHLIRDHWVEVALPVTPPVKNLLVKRTGNRVRLEWEPPVFDTGKSQIVGYEVIAQEGTPGAALRHQSLATLNDQARWFEINHSGNIAYYNVRPIYRSEGTIVFGPGSGGPVF